LTFVLIGETAVAAWGLTFRGLAALEKVGSVKDGRSGKFAAPAFEFVV